MAAYAILRLVQNVGRYAANAPGIALVLAGLLASPASAGTLSQTQSYTTGPSATPSSPWTHVFSFAPFVGPTATSRLSGVHLLVTGTQVTGSGILDCVYGAGGMGLGAKFCNVAGYRQGATFSLVSPPVFASAASNLTVQQTQSYPGGLMALEDNAFVPLGNAVPISGSTATGAYNYYNTLVSSGGTLDPMLFAGPGTIDVTYQMTPFSGVDLNGAGSAGLGFDSIAYSLTVSLAYDYVDTHEPASLALLGVAATGLLIVRHRRRIA